MLQNAILASQELSISYTISNTEERNISNDSSKFFVNDTAIIIYSAQKINKNGSFAAVMIRVGYGLFLVGTIALCAGFIGGWIFSDLVFLTQSPYFAYEIISVFSGYILYRIGKQVELNGIINHNRDKLEAEYFLSY